MTIISEAIVAWWLLLPLAFAFYPIHLGPPVTQRREQPPSVPPSGLLTLPLHRTLIQRDSIYKIIPSKPPKQANSAAVDQDGTDMSYMVSVALGSSSKQMNLLLDSAASNTWVMGSNCKTEACNIHNTFGAADSRTLVASNVPFEIYYGTGSVSGQVATDILRISSLSPTVQFGIGVNVSSDFKSYPMDGILGLGRGDNTPNTIEAPSLMEVLINQKLIQAKLFGVYLSRTTDGLQDGELNFGEPNTARFDGDLNFIPIIPNTDGFWEIPVADVSIGGKKLGLQGRSAIIDTGTSFILMPKDDAIALHKLIPGSAQSGETFTVPCQTKQSLQFVFNGVGYNVSTADLVGSKLDNDRCRTNIIGRQTFGDKRWLVGDVFLKNVYSVFDFDKSRVGFGFKRQEKAVHAGPSTASKTVSSSNPTATRSKHNDIQPTPQPFPPTMSTGATNSAASTGWVLEKPKPTAESQQGAGSPTPSTSVAWRRHPFFKILAAALLIPVFSSVL